MDSIASIHNEPYQDILFIRSLSTEAETDLAYVRQDDHNFPIKE
jgi:hypothetical protein